MGASSASLEVQVHILAKELSFWVFLENLHVLLDRKYLDTDTANPHRISIACAEHSGLTCGAILGKLEKKNQLSKVD